MERELMLMYKLDSLTEKMDRLISLIHQKSRIKEEPGNASTSKPAEHAVPSTSSGATQSEAKPSGFDKCGYQKPIPTPLAWNISPNVEAPPPDNEIAQLEKSKKSEKMVNNYMEKKLVIMVPGVGDAAAKKLGESNITLASELYFLYLKLKKDEFRSRMEKEYGVRKHDSKEMVLCFDAYNKKYGNKIRSVNN